MTKFALKNWLSKLTQENNELVNNFYNQWVSFEQYAKQVALQYKKIEEFVAMLNKGICAHVQAKIDQALLFD